MLNPAPILTEIFCFLLEVPSIEGTVVEKRIADYCAKGNQSAAVYRLKVDPASNLSRNTHMYTDAQLEQLKESARAHLYYFGYTDHPDAGRADEKTTFITYDKEAKHD